MKTRCRKQLLALACCACYLLQVGGVALSSLLCPCVELHHHTASCCHNHSHEAMHPMAAAHDADLATPCCDDNHSLHIALYTADSERKAQRWLPIYTTLVALPTPEQEAFKPLVGHLLSLATRKAPPTASAEAACFGLRAPPVLV